MGERAGPDEVITGWRGTGERGERGATWRAEGHGQVKGQLSSERDPGAHMQLITAENIGKTEQGAAHDWTKRMEQHPAGYTHYREAEEEDKESQETI